jgi:hypothetical protein
MMEISFNSLLKEELIILCLNLKADSVIRRTNSAEFFSVVSVASTVFHSVDGQPLLSVSLKNLSSGEILTFLSENETDAFEFGVTTLRYKDGDSFSVHSAPQNFVGYPITSGTLYSLANSDPNAPAIPSFTATPILAAMFREWSFGSRRTATVVRVILPHLPVLEFRIEDDVDVTIQPYRLRSSEYVPSVLGWDS